MQKLKIMVLVALTAGISGCDTLARIGLERASDSRIRYGAHCETLRMQCRAENYREWETAEGKRGCSCHGPSDQQRYPGEGNQPGII